MPFATQEKVAEGFTAAGERMDDLRGDMTFLKDNLNRLYKQFKAYHKAYMTGKTETGQVYNRCWPTEGQAKQFGSIVLAALGFQGLEKDMVEGTDSAGGYTVPEELMSRLIDLMHRYGKFRANAMVLPMGSNKSLVPQVTADLTVYAPGEGTEITKSDMTFGQVELDAIKMCCLTAFSTELEEDSVLAIGEIVGISIVR